MRSSDIFPSRYLKAADLDGKEPIVTIDRVEMEQLGDETKPIVYFKGKEKGVVLNRTNFTAIEDISGEEDTDNWAGVKIKLVTARVDFKGQRVPAIRIEAPSTATHKTAKRTPAPEPEPEPVADEDDEIPF